VSAGVSDSGDSGLVQILEAAILAADKPLTVQNLADLFEQHERPENSEIRDALKEVAQRCEGRGFELQEVASGFRFQVRQQLSPWVARLWSERPARYSRALLETLALIAYRQPITRGEIEEIRGVAVSSNIIKTLHERDWIRVVGHRDVPGRPAMYATTRAFLDYFNLKSLDQLPVLAEIRDLDTLTAELGFEPLPHTSSAQPEAAAADAGGENAVGGHSDNSGEGVQQDSQAPVDAGEIGVAELKLAAETAGAASAPPSDDGAAGGGPADRATNDGSNIDRGASDQSHG
jgi:segregation and condensation protein B